MTYRIRERCTLANFYIISGSQLTIYKSHPVPYPPSPPPLSHLQLILLSHLRCDISNPWKTCAMFVIAYKFWRFRLIFLYSIDGTQTYANRFSKTVTLLWVQFWWEFWIVPGSTYLYKWFMIVFISPGRMPRAYKEEEFG